jgi:2-polyprenyl-3-methyl-5-hydroxy-6-metoxy-1,4-benzoquinol methylase
VRPRLRPIEAGSESSNYQKFQTGNPIVLALINRFYERLRETVEPLAADSLLDAGCGEGETLLRLLDLLPPRVAAIDLSASATSIAAERLTGVELSAQNVEALRFASRSFDLVLCLEVLEHLANPDVALQELARVSGHHLVVSVPHEPWFRLGSLLRGNYLRGLGNHPEHVNHWNRSGLRRLLEPHFSKVSLVGAFPWLIALCQR